LKSIAVLRWKLIYLRRLTWLNPRGTAASLRGGACLLSPCRGKLALEALKEALHLQRFFIALYWALLLFIK